MMKKSSETVEDIMKKQLSMLEHSDKLAKLEKESLRDKKIIQELKEREKVSARALVLFERKLKFLKESLISEILKLCKVSEDAKTMLFEGEDESLESCIIELNKNLYDVCNRLEMATSISENDKAFILNKPVLMTEKEDTQTRFDRLKANFDQKIGTSVLRKPGRPKKQDQSIVADIGLGKKVEKVIDENSETKNRLNEIFYGTPSGKTVAISNIPQTEDASFDFAEALNPNHSLQDIMSDIMSDLSSSDPIKYSKDNLDSQISRLKDNEIKSLESGVLSKPKVCNNFEDDDIDEVSNVHQVHKNGILTEKKLFDDIKK